MVTILDIRLWPLIMLRTMVYIYVPIISTLTAYRQYTSSGTSIAAAIYIFYIEIGIDIAMSQKTSSNPSLAQCVPSKVSQFNSASTSQLLIHNRVSTGTKERGFEEEGCEVQGQRSAGPRRSADQKAQRHDTLDACYSHSIRRESKSLSTNVL